jgi:type IV pilus assembly protein PilM
LLNLFRSSLGVDFGTSSLKVVGIKGKTVSLAAVANIEENRHDARGLGRQLETFFAGLGLRGSQAVVNNPGTHTFVRTVLFPHMPARELRDALMWEVKRQLPYPVENAVLDYVATESAEQIAVTFAASEKQFTEEHIAPLRAAGLDVVAVDVNPLCLLRTASPSTAGNTVILDIGDLDSEIHIVKNGVLRITRTVGGGADTIRKRLVREGAGREDAERLLREGSVAELETPLSDISLEVFRSLDFYKANFKEASIAEIILCGGPSLNPAVRDYFSQGFGLPVSVVDPFKDFRLSDEAIRPLGPLFSIAVGLARRKP